MQWVTIAAGALLVAVVLAAWQHGRTLRAELDTRAREHDVARARLRNELSAAAAVAARAEAEADRARHAASSAQRERERLQQRLQDVQAHSVTGVEHRALQDEAESLRQEVAVLRRELDLIGPVIAELSLQRSYVETLQRELGLRDELVISLEQQAAGLAARPAAGLHGGPPRFPMERSRASVEPVVIDLTEGHAELVERGSAGQRRQVGVVEPAGEEGVEGPAGDG
ncbi:MAG: hypothetical protein IT196_12670 [Acidimicrobiales bacterium]|nr:hypothetical protein [Acidimicrobiales bacterium]